MKKKVSLLRAVPEGYVNLRGIGEMRVQEKTTPEMVDLLRSQNLTEGPHLRPGDMVVVPKTALSKLERFIPLPSLGVFFNPFSF